MSGSWSDAFLLSGARNICDYGSARNGGGGGLDLVPMTQLQTVRKEREAQTERASVAELIKSAAQQPRQAASKGSLILDPDSVPNS